MNAIGTVIVAIVGTVVLVPVVYVMGTLIRTAISAIRSRDDSRHPAKQEDGFVDSLAWSLRWGEVANPDPAESHESMGGPPASGGPG